jgi:hypothetical protein
MELLLSVLTASKTQAQMESYQNCVRADRTSPSLPAKLFQYTSNSTQQFQ